MIRRDSYNDIVDASIVQILNEGRNVVVNRLNRVRDERVGFPTSVGDPLLHRSLYLESLRNDLIRKYGDSYLPYYRRALKRYDVNIGLVSVDNEDDALSSDTDASAAITVCTADVHVDGSFSHSNMTLDREDAFSDFTLSDVAPAKSCMHSCDPLDGFSLSTLFAEDCRSESSYVSCISSPDCLSDIRPVAVVPPHSVIEMDHDIDPRTNNYFAFNLNVLFEWCNFSRDVDNVVNELAGRLGIIDTFALSCLRVLIWIMLLFLKLNRFRTLFCVFYAILCFVTFFLEREPDNQLDELVNAPPKIPGYFSEIKF